MLWVIGVVIRYGVIFPFRLAILVLGISLFVISLTAARILGLVDVERRLFTLACKLWLFSYGAVIRHHGIKPRLSPSQPHLFVANHTSFTDFIVLSSHDYPHGVVAQHHGGLFGIFMKYILELYGSVSFNRHEQKDRIKVAERILKHVNDPNQFAPLLIFPEGTCVNNESTVLFHKGVFELDCTICPVGIKYNKKLLDPYWNTREQTFSQHVVYLMTRWMMMVDVYWLAPQKRLENESAIEFADRAKSMISQVAGLKNRSWNGYLKNVMRALDRERLQKSSQSKYAGYLRVMNVSSESVNVLSTSSESEGRSSADNSPAKPIAISRKPTGSSAPARRRRSMPNVHSLHTPPEFPQWLNEAAVIDAKNNMMIHGRGLSLATTQLNSLKESVMASITQYSQEEERSSPSEPNSIG